MDKILLIDGDNQMWRASISFAPPKKNPEPEPWPDPDLDIFTDVNVQKEPIAAEDKPDYQIVFNFFRNLRPLIEQFQPDKCFFVLEGHAQFRYDLFPEYKANRKIVKTASRQEELDRFRPQKEIIIDLMKHLPVTIVKADDYEADDVIATLARNLLEEDVTILSSDTDFIQLLQIDNSNIKIYNPIAKKFYSDPGYHYVAWKCLKGDTSDNIPGFDGIGDKKAQKLISDPVKFEEFLSKEENRANFNIYRSLIELKSVPVDELRIEEGQPHWNLLREEFDKMEFNSITNDRSWKKYTETFSCIKY